MKVIRRYTNPPIVEVVCEFRFKVKDPNDLTVPGRFYEKILQDYPKKEEVHEYEVGVEFSQKELQQKLRRKILGMQYRNEEGKNIIRVTPNLVSAHRLSPYSSWEDFSIIAKRALATFQEIVQPEALERVSLRYIDRIEIPHPSFELSEYIRIYPKTPEEVIKEIGNFFMRLEIPFHGGRDILILMLHTPPNRPEGKSWIILDWDYALIRTERIGMDGVWNWVEEAHERIIATFEASITDACRQLFEEVR